MLFTIQFTGTFIQNIVYRHISSRTQRSFGAGTNNIDSFCCTCLISFIQICLCQQQISFSQTNYIPIRIISAIVTIYMFIRTEFPNTREKSDRIISRYFIKIGIRITGSFFRFI